jgi:hypothetical protein
VLTQERLKKLLIYERRTGRFIWRLRPVRCKQDATWNSAWSGKEAGSLKPSGYILICVDYQLYRAHRLAFLYVLGRFPIADVDHKNRIRSDNRWRNLREASRSQNLANGRHKKSDRGVRRLPCGTWQARIAIKGNSQGLGTFRLKRDAIAAYKKAAKKRFGNFHR